MAAKMLSGASTFLEVPVEDSQGRTDAHLAPELQKRLARIEKGLDVESLQPGRFECSDHAAQDRPRDMVSAADDVSRLDGRSEGLDMW